VSNSVAAFVLLMLATVTFDGFPRDAADGSHRHRRAASRPVAETLFALSSATGMDETQWLNTVRCCCSRLASC
jgi:hypothetical protein